MNRLKKVLRQKGIKMNNDYECLPYNIKGEFMKPGNIVIEDVIVNSETATITEIYNVDISVKRLLRNGQFQNVSINDSNPSFGEETQKSMRYFMDENDNIVSEAQLRADFESGISESETFEQYIRNCTDKNGTLTEITI